MLNQAQFTQALFFPSPMKAATERRVIRWLHLLASIPILGFIYGPVADIPRAAFAVRFVLMPMVVLSGIWLWKGYVLRRWFKSNPPQHQV